MASQPVQIEQPRDDARASAWMFWAVVSACVVLLGVQIAHYYPFMADDAFISLRYSQRLVEGKGLTWSGDQRTEGYTNLLWVLLCALLGALHVDLVMAARLLGLVCTLAAFAAVVAYIVLRFPPRQRALAAGCGLLPFALSAPFAVWAIGGLEQPLLIALLAWATFFARRWLRGRTMGDAWACGALLALVTITRADGFGLALLFCVALLVGGGWRPAGRVVLLPSLMLLAQLAFRHKYYRDWLPNTAHVKVSFTAHRLMTGLAYLRLGLSMELPMFALAAVGVWALWRRRERAEAFLLAFVPAAFLLYLVLVGGDIFPALRLMLPVLLLSCFAAAEAAWLAFAERGKLRPVAAVGLLACGIATAYSRVGSVVATFERWEWEGKSLGLALRAGFGDRHPLLVADCAGAVPFFSGFEALDPLGLNDRYIARKPAPQLGTGMMGHELGDGGYIIAHKPEIVLFLTPEGSALPRFYSDFLIYNDTRFAPAYQLVRLHVTGDRAAGGPAVENPDMVSTLFIRRDGRLGMEMTPDRVTVPAYLAKPEGSAFVAASVPDGVRLVLPPGGAASLQQLPLPGGCWRISTDSDGIEGPNVLCGSASGAPLDTAEVIRNFTTKTLTVHSIHLDRETEGVGTTSTPRSGDSGR